MRLSTVSMVVCVGFGGCFGGSPPIRYFALEPAAPTQVVATPYPFTLLVQRFETALVYDRREIVFRPAQHEVRVYDYRHWVARPGRMVAAAVAAHIDTLGLFEAVTTRSTERTAQYVLRGEVTTLDELDLVETKMGEGPSKLWRARLGLKLEVSVIDTQAVIWRHHFEVERQVEHNDPRAVVATLVAIFEDELERALIDLDQTLATHTKTAPRISPTSATP